MPIAWELQKLSVLENLCIELNKVALPECYTKNNKHVSHKKSVI